MVPGDCVLGVVYKKQIVFVINISPSVLFYAIASIEDCLPHSFTSNAFSEKKLKDMLSDVDVIIDLVEALLHRHSANLM